ncbi:MAG: C4-type zinc ribbon domain-containing protein [Bacteroidota bacterium]|nr:C4-type zinc ribbon domain-containing protein [Bacteroidota bacterium]
MSDKAKKEITVYERLKALYKLQVMDSKIDELRRLRGDTPLKVKDLEDEIIGLKTRAEKIDSEKITLEEQIVEKKNIIKESKAKLKKYEEQQKKVRNNREFEALSKQIEYEELELQLSDKRIKEYTYKTKEKNEAFEQLKEEVTERENDYENAKEELDGIIVETEKDEQTLKDLRVGVEEKIEKRLLVAYLRIRKGLRNGLAVVPIRREACGGCFNRIPPQRQIDVESHKKIIVCEFCGRVLVDDEIVELVDEEIKKLKIDIKLYD